MGVLTDSLRTYNLQKGDLDELYGIFRSVNDYDIPIVRYIIYPSSGLIRQRINPHGKEFYSISELNYPPAICFAKIWTGKSSISINVLCLFFYRY